MTVSPIRVVSALSRPASGGVRPLMRIIAVVAALAALLAIDVEAVAWAAAVVSGGVLAAFSMGFVLITVFVLVTVWVMETKQ